jgi:hypothetical protein
MPEISRFYGIIIRMYYDEHPPPHFHVIYAEGEAQIGIDPIQVLSSDLPGRVISMAIEWAALHQRELKEDWDQMRADQSPKKIAPLR